MLEFKEVHDGKRDLKVINLDVIFADLGVERDFAVGETLWPWKELEMTDS
mgnify:CR=1 FL=1